MTDKEILHKAIKRAFSNGWDIDKNVPLVKEENIAELWVQDDLYFIFIFSHSFAKAFWGEGNFPMYYQKYDEVNEYGEPQIGWIEGKRLYIWQYHLQQMVLEEEPLRYLEKFLQ